MDMGLRVQDPIVKFCAMAAGVSILIVLFMVAPIGSIYVFLISLHQGKRMSMTTEESAAFIMDLLQKNSLLRESGGGANKDDDSSTTTTTAALDEIWSTVIANPAFAELLHQRTLQYHMRLVMPWLVAFLLIVSITCLIVVCRAWSMSARHQQHRGRQPTRWWHQLHNHRRHAQEQRIRKIMATALDCQVVVTSTTTNDDDGNATDNNNVCGICFEGFSSSHGDNQHEEVDNCNNRNGHRNRHDDDKDQRQDSNAVAVRGSTCPHTFHEHCVSQWLCRRRSHYQCPLCRQDFLDAATTRKLIGLSCW